MMFLLVLVPSASVLTGILLLHAAATLTMFGVILVVQFVHYPLFRLVGTGSFAAYQSAHMTRITWIVLPAMTAELLTAIALVGWQPLGIPAWQAWTGLGLVLLIWASTGLVQAPIHQSLTAGFDPSAHRRLVATNGVRTGAWTLRAGLVLWMLAPLLRSAPA
jgi:hypothetical protein